MKHIQRLLLLTPFFILGVAVQAAPDRGRDGQRDQGAPDQAVTQDRGSQPPREAQPARESQPAPAPQPKAARPARSNGRMNKQPAQRSAPALKQRAAPSQRSAPARKQRTAPAQRSAPAQNQWTAPAQKQRAAPVQRSAPAPRGQAVQQPNRAPAVASRPAKSAALPSHTKPYDRQRLTNLGVRTIPKPITSHSAILRTDRTRSVIRYPQTGPQDRRIQGSLISARGFNNGTVRAQMSVVIQPSFNLRLDDERRGENQRDHYYWHTDNGFYYNHFIDDWGYHWYGWYRGDQYFWTRHFNGRWWWYDPDYDRWCYYQDSNWYWQDPSQQDAIYVYDNDNYISLDFNFHN